MHPRVRSRPSRDSFCSPQSSSRRLDANIASLHANHEVNQSVCLRSPLLSSPLVSARSPLAFFRASLNRNQRLRSPDRRDQIIPEGTTCLTSIVVADGSSNYLRAFARVEYAAQDAMRRIRYGLSGRSRTSKRRVPTFRTPNAPDSTSLSTSTGEGQARRQPVLRSSVPVAGRP